MSLRSRVLVLIFLSVFTVAFAQEGELPDRIVFHYPNVIPEGVEWDAEGQRFLVSSVTLGTIFAVTDDGTVAPFIEDEALTGTGGLQIDVERQRLLVVNFEAPASLGIYDLASGERLHMVDLEAVTPEGKTSCANDVAVDPDGNAYVTNHCAAMIYQVDVNGVASVLVEDEHLAADVGVNGIEYHPNGYLLVAVTGNLNENFLLIEGSEHLYKIPLEDPIGMTEVVLDTHVYGDGLIWHPDGSLIFTGGYFDAEGVDRSGVHVVRSGDEWQTALVESHSYDADNRYASTSAIRDVAVYKVYFPYELIGSDPPAEEFEIARVVFEEGAM